MISRGLLFAQRQLTGTVAIWSSSQSARLDWIDCAGLIGRPHGVGAAQIGGQANLRAKQQTSRAD